MRIVKIAAFCAASLAASASLAAEWISGDYVRPDENDTAAFYRECPNDVLKRDFDASAGSVSKAVWRVASPGMRDLFVNGERVTSTALPPWTPYGKRVLEECFDVTRLLRAGAKNELRVDLGNGWWNLMPIAMWYKFEMWKILAQGVPCVKATLEIEYADGSRQTVETDGAWIAGKGRIVKNSIYMGVREDARREVGEWKPARIAVGPAGRVLPAGDFPKTVIYDRWAATGVVQVAKNVWRVDFGVNFAGTFRAKMRGLPKGALVKFRAGERLNDDRTVNVMTAVAGQVKKPSRGPLFDIAEQRDEWVSNGDAEETFEPRFTFHAFRFLQIEAVAGEGSGTRLEIAPEPQDFEALAWSADVQEGAHFECSNEKVNRLHEVCRRTFRANMQSVQSDCPGREKFGYGGDIAASAESFRCNWQMAAFYRKTVRDFLDEAEDDGLFTETAPYVGIGSKPVIPKEETAPRAVSPMGWALGVPVLLDVLVRYDGDLDIVKEAYPALVRYIGILSARYPNDSLPPCIGDHNALEKASTWLTSLAHWHEFIAKTAKFARLIGKTDDARRFDEHCKRIAAKFRAKYVKPGGVVNTGLQGEQLFALYNGLLEPGDRAGAFDVLKRDIEAHGCSPTTGFFGTQYIFEVLSAAGDTELAGKVAFHKGFPGYFHMLDCGATTLLEHWEDEKCRYGGSNCHPMFGGVEQWLTRYVLGICVPENAVGCDRIRIAPHAVPGVTSAAGSLDTPKGRVSVKWRLAGGKMEIEKSLPPGIVEEKRQ